MLLLLRIVGGVEIEDHLHWRLPMRFQERGRQTALRWLLGRD
jgi:hypothetical protein